MHSRQQIHHDLASIVRNFNGREYSGELAADTLFFADLGMMSIDAVVLAEKLEQLYARPFPFHEFVADLTRRQVQDIALGELEDFLYNQLNK